MDRCLEHVKANHAVCLREPKGELCYKYIVPSGPYEQLWDWDAMFTGVGLLPFGAAPYLAGSMANFLHRVDSNGHVPGCLTPSGPSKTLYHAKPVIIQGAWIGAKHSGETQWFRQFETQMVHFLDYFDRERAHAETGLYVWYNQMESGADNLVLSEKTDQLCLSSPDIMTFLFREHRAMALFLRAWADHSTTQHDEKESLLAKASKHEAKAEAIRTAINTHLWGGDGFGYLGYNTKKSCAVKRRTFLLAFPLWEPALVAQRPDIVDVAIAELCKPDMWSQNGVRSTSRDDALYNNENIIVPDSNWQGPLWICSNSVLAYALNKYPQHKHLAGVLAQRVVDMLATDLENTQVWHECYHGESGEGLAAPGFLSWNVLGAYLTQNIRNNVDPFEL